MMSIAPILRPDRTAEPAADRRGPPGRTRADTTGTTGPGFPFPFRFRGKPPPGGYDSMVMTRGPARSVAIGATGPRGPLRHLERASMHLYHPPAETNEAGRPRRTA